MKKHLIFFSVLICKLYVEYMRIWIQLICFFISYLYFDLMFVSVDPYQCGGSRQ